MNHNKMSPANLLVELYLHRSKFVLIVWGSIFLNSWFWHLQVRWCQWENMYANVMFIAHTCIMWALHIRKLSCAFIHSFINPKQCFNEIVTDPHLDRAIFLYHLSFYLNALYSYLPFQSKCCHSFTHLLVHCVQCSPIVRFSWQLLLYGAHVFDLGDFVDDQ